ncbi:MAG: carboxymuconolactone decarboxylase family protein [Thermomicrobiales bacterium]
MPHKVSALILVALNASCTARNTDGTRTAIRAALQAGASRDEVLSVLKMAALLAIHSCSLGAPLLLAELPETPEGGVPEGIATPACDAMRAIGQWNTAWDPFLALDPVWTDQFMATGLCLYQEGILPAKEVELLSIALDAAITHMYAPGVGRHIHGALTAGATPAEIMAVLELCVAFGVTALAASVPILAEELATVGGQ